MQTVQIAGLAEILALPGEEDVKAGRIPPANEGSVQCRAIAKREERVVFRLVRMCPKGQDSGEGAWNPQCSMSCCLSMWIRSFCTVREQDFHDVDNPPLIRQLVGGGCDCFRSRPRRFGMSLFLDTLTSLFEDHEALFAAWTFTDTVTGPNRVHFHRNLYSGSVKAVRGHFHSSSRTAGLLLNVKYTTLLPIS